MYCWSIGSYVLVVLLFIPPPRLTMIAVVVRTLAWNSMITFVQKRIILEGFVCWGDSPTPMC